MLQYLANVVPCVVCLITGLPYLYAKRPDMRRLKVKVCFYEVAILFDDELNIGKSSIVEQIITM